MINYKKYINEVQDFPTKGISFKDISPLLADRTIFKSVINKMGNLFLKGIKPEEIYVVILWPGPWRTEIYVPDLKDKPLWEGWVPLCPNNDEQYKKQHSPLVYNYYK